MRFLRPALRHPLLLVVVFSAIGVAAVLIEVVRDNGRSFGDVVYDGGIGVLIATALGGLVAYRMQRYEHLQEEARRKYEAAQEAARERAEQVERQHQESFRQREEELRQELERIGRDMDNAIERVDKTLAEVEVRKLAISIIAVHHDIMAIRQHLDPAYEHPHAALIEEWMIKLENEVKRRSESPEDTEPPS